VLFTLIAERYERRSLAVTSNVVFSQWQEIFQSPMATAAAIDRVVHHSVILEFDVPSYRTAEATATQARPRARRRLRARGHRGEDRSVSARPQPPGGRNEEMSLDPFRGGISLPPKSGDRRT
jgi:hypothetical protein